jgi:hypothetical protein
MPRSIEWERQCYGTPIELFVKSVEMSSSFKCGDGNWGMVAMSQLSDGQELLAMGHADAARQHMNIAKWIISTKLIDPKATPRA